MHCRDASTRLRARLSLLRFRQPLRREAEVVPAMGLSGVGKNLANGRLLSPIDRRCAHSCTVGKITPVNVPEFRNVNARARARAKSERWRARAMQDGRRVGAREASGEPH
jgi:hypothetical protein